MFRAFLVSNNGTDFDNATQAFKHFSFVPAVQQLLYLRRRHLLNRSSSGSCISSGLEREVACCLQSDRFLIRVCVCFHDTCFQHARDTRYRFHLGCDLSRRNRELEWSSSNVWRGCNFHLAHVMSAHVPAAALNLLRPCHIFCSSQLSARPILSVTILSFPTV